MTSKIRVGIIGATPDRGWAATVHVPALAALPDFELTAVCTSRPDSAKEAAAKFGAVHAFTDPAALAASPDVDLVTVSVKVPQHDALVRAGLNSGKPVFCEWPLGRTTAEAAKMTADMQTRGLTGIVGLQARFSPLIRYVRDLIAEGRIGEVLSCTLTATTPTWGPVADRFSTYLYDDANGANLLTINGGHTLDALCFCLGDFRELTAHTAVRQPDAKTKEAGETIRRTAVDQIAVAGTLQSGAIATLHFRAGTATGSGLQFEINGSDGDLLVCTDTGLGIQNADLVLRGALGRGRPFEDMPVPTHYFRTPAFLPNARVRNVCELYADIARCFKTGGTPELDFALAVRRHQLLDAIRRSSAEGRKVAL